MNLPKTIDRIFRYESFMNSEFVNNLCYVNNYSLNVPDQSLYERIRNNFYNRIVAIGMGASAVVNDLFRIFLIEEKLEIPFVAVRDYDFRYLIDNQTIESNKTLFIISSYSGYSMEPLLAYRQLAPTQSKNILVLTSGGKLLEEAKQNSSAILLWQLQKPDREYPLFHVPQYFAILVDAFQKLGFFKSNYPNLMSETGNFISNFMTEERQLEAREIAHRLKGGDITMIATPRWYQGLFGILRMHFNEIAIVPCHRNHFHEFCHSEAAVFSDPDEKHSILLIQDPSEDEYTKAKMENLVNLFTHPIPQNRNIEMIVYNVIYGNFCTQLFSTLYFMHYVVLELALIQNTQGRELLSSAAGNPWYSQEFIEREK